MTYTYDANGNLNSRVDASGTTSYAFDAQNRLTAKTTGAGTTTSLAYDRASNVTSFTDPTGSVGYAYDNANRLTALAEPGGSCPEDDILVITSLDRLGRSTQNMLVFADARAVAPGGRTNRGP